MMSCKGQCRPCVCSHSNGSPATSRRLYILLNMSLILSALYVARRRDNAMFEPARAEVLGKTRLELFPARASTSTARSRTSHTILRPFSPDASHSALASLPP